MKRRILHSFAEILSFCILSGLAFAQLQSRIFFQLPPGEHLVEPAGVAVNSKGHIYVFHRGKHPLMEFEFGDSNSGSPPRSCSQADATQWFRVTGNPESDASDITIVSLGHDSLRAF